MWLERIDVRDAPAALHPATGDDARLEKILLVAPKLTGAGAQSGQAVHHLAPGRQAGLRQGLMNSTHQLGEPLDDQVAGVASPEPLFEDQLAKDHEMAAVTSEIDDEGRLLFQVLEEPPIMRRKKYVAEAGDLPSVVQHERAASDVEQRAGRQAGQSAIEKSLRKHRTILADAPSRR